MTDIKLTPGQKAVQERIAPHVERACQEAQALGIPFLCMIQTPGLMPGIVDLAVARAHVDGFKHRAPRRLIVDFFGSGKVDPSEPDFTPAGASMLESFVGAAAMWVGGTEYERDIALAAALVLNQVLQTLPNPLRARVHAAVASTIGSQGSVAFYDAANAKLAAGMSGTLSAVSVPAATPTEPGQN